MLNQIAPVLWISNVSHAPQDLVLAASARADISACDILIDTLHDTL
jgi:hypothetical protein